MSTPVRTLDLFAADSPVPLEAVLCKVVAILGIRGSGKTTAARRIVEQLAGHGVPMTIFDYKGEYWGLLERFPFVVIGRSEHAHFDASPRQAEALARMSLRDRVSVILDFSEHAESEMFAFADAYMAALWQAARKMRQPYTVVLEEAQEWAPQNGERSSPRAEALKRMVMTGRSYGVGLILVAQRSALVRKDLLTQAECYLLGRATHPADLSVYKELCPLPGPEVERLVSTAAPGGMLCCLNSHWERQQMALAQTFGAGYTPSLDAADDEDEEERFQPVALDRSVLDALEGARRQGADDESQALSPEQVAVSALTAQLAETRTENARLKGRVAHMEDQLEVACTIRMPEQVVLNVNEAIVKHMRFGASGQAGKSGAATDGQMVLAGLAG
ncbi:MAG: DUF87 domain-containing protein [Chloroflexota bacterium]|jgi:hypothetical protein|nr:DUF87 domain-containing protein [Chloroflexota bacterium]